MPPSQWEPTVTQTGLAGALHYSSGAVVIGATSNRTRAWPWLKLYVNGPITANNIRWFSDAELKEDIQPLQNSLSNILSIN